MRTKQPIEFAYLYLPAKQGMELLQSGEITWSAPHTWNNPFELSPEQELPFDVAQLKQAVLKGIAGLVFGPQPPDGIPEHPIPKAIQRWRSSQRFVSEEEVERDLSKIVDGMINQHRDIMLRILDDWKSFYKGHRLLRMYKENKNLYLWKHLAEDFSGMAFKFDVSDSDTSFENIQPVKYQTEALSISKLKDQVDHILGMRESNPQQDFMDNFYAQPKGLSQEKELRAVCKIDKEAQDTWHVAKPFKGAELKAVYLGNNFAEANITTVKNLLNEAYYHSVLYRLGIDNKVLELSLNREAFK